MELFNVYLWVQIISGIVGIMVLAVVLYSAISIIVVLNRLIKNATHAATKTKERISLMMERSWLFRLLFAEENDR